MYTCLKKQRNVTQNLNFIMTSNSPRIDYDAFCALVLQPRINVFPLKDLHGIDGGLLFIAIDGINQEYVSAFHECDDAFAFYAGAISKDNLADLIDCFHNTTVYTYNVFDAHAFDSVRDDIVNLKRWGRIVDIGAPSSLKCDLDELQATTKYPMILTEPDGVYDLSDWSVVSEGTYPRQYLTGLAKSYFLYLIYQLKNNRAEAEDLLAEMMPVPVSNGFDGDNDSFVLFVWFFVGFFAMEIILYLLS